MKILESLRYDRRMTQAELGQKAGIPQSTISYWEQGHGGPKPEEVARLARALDVSPETLIPKIEDLPNKQ